MENLLNLVFTSKCIFCGRLSRVICEECAAKLPKHRGDFCIVCQKPAFGGITHPKCSIGRMPPEAIICIYTYENMLKKLISEAKYKGKHFALLKELCMLNKEFLQNRFGTGSELSIVPIPLSKEKNTTRGFNQAAVIAREIAKLTKLPVAENVLFRIKNTKAQFHNKRKQRFENLADAFYANPAKVAGKNFLVVDDISTSGATFLEASRIMYNAQATSITCFALCKRM